MSLHGEAIIIDGLIVSDWGRPVFEAMHAGGLTAANCTTCVWENFRGCMDNLARFKGWFREYADIIRPVRTVADIEAAKREGRVGIILGWQNLSGIEDQVGYLALFKELGVGIMQMAYNTRNLVGDGCYEARDGGLSDFGREVVAEMNRLGILCDLSHVGARTSQDVIECSKQPVAYSHVCPAALKAHPRNKTDAQLRAIVARGGFIGVTMFPPFLRRGTEATVEDYLEVIEHTINVVGEDHVGIGTDFTQGYGQPFFDWITHDKGYARRLVDLGEIVMPAGLRRIEDFPNLTGAMERAGWPERRIRKVLGLNWMRLLREVWGR
jgi:membrane dipeptidase